MILYSRYKDAVPKALVPVGAADISTDKYSDTDDTDDSSDDEQQVVKEDGFEIVKQQKIKKRKVQIPKRNYDNFGRFVEKKILTFFR